MENYQRILDCIEQSLAVNNSVSLLLPGHPRLGVTVTQIINTLKKKLGSLEVNIVPGISSFATMYNDLELDPLEKGSAILDVNRLLLYEYSMEPGINYFIYHICSIGNRRTNFINPSQENKIDLLKNYLLRYYSKDHEVFMVESQSSLCASKIHKFTIDKLEDLLQVVNFNSSLFIPAIKLDRINKPFLSLISEDT